MNPSTQLKLQRIQRLSRFLRTLCTALLVLIALLFAFAAIGALSGGDASLAFDDIHISLPAYPLLTRLLLVALVALLLGVLCKALYHLHRLFSQYVAGHILTAGAARQIRQIGWTAILWFALNLLTGFALIRWLDAAHHAAPPLRLDALFLGLLLIVISWFIQAAAELQEENRLTI
jgi:hypothetical protein